jgi:vacuolar-type H+-ATPase subunit C/Vma6
MTPVPFIEYINVRIKGYHGRLFDRDTYESLLSGDNLGGISTYLLSQPRYRQDVETALEHHSEREGLEYGVTGCFGRSIGEIRGMADGKVRELIDLTLYSFDMKNLRTVLLAHLRKTPAHQVRDLILPCGGITSDRLDVFLSAPDIPSLASAMRSSCQIAADSIDAAYAEMPLHEEAVKQVNRVERAMYRRILARLDANDQECGFLREIYRLEIDLRNVTLALKHLWEGRTPDHEQFNPYIPGGSITIPFLEEMSRAGALDEAFEMLEETPFHEAVEKGIIYYAETGFLHEMERFFEEVFIRRTQKNKRIQPLGIAVFVGYLWNHYVEMTNLRTIVNGIAFKASAGQIRKGLIYA